MSKLRVFELAKELNTTSKRLIEKLEEINVKVKSHMSLLEEDELDRLYKHIGVVNRNRVEETEDNSGVQGEPQPENHVVRKSIPRIIRKTEIIIHDDDYIQDKKAKEKKKSRRSYVRTSSSTDGLMAGLQRGSEKHPVLKNAPVQQKKKTEEDEKTVTRKKAEDIKGVQELKEEGVVGITQRSSRIRRPVDSILSIKKVSPAEKREKQLPEDETAGKDVDQGNTIKADFEKADKTPKEDTVAAPEKTEAEKVKEKVDKKADIQKETVSADAEKKENNMEENFQDKSEAKTIRKDKAAHEEKKQPLASDKRDLPSKDTKETIIAEDRVTKNNVSPVKTEGQGERSKERQRTRDSAGERNKNQTQGKYQPRQRTPGEPERNRKGSQTGDSRNHAMGKQEEGHRRFNQTSGGPNRGQERFGTGSTGSRGPNREGGQGSQGRGYDRNRPQGARGRNEERAGAANKPLVIPKANLAPGQAEEKNTLRGERRSAVTRDLEKGFKREAKKELPKKDVLKNPALTPGDKNKDKYKKNYVVGHTAKVKDMYSDDFVLNEFYNEKVKPRKERKGKRVEKHIPPKAVLQEITIPETITVKNLAEALKKTSADVIKKLMMMGIMANLNQELDFDTAAIIGDEYKVKVKKAVVISDEDILFDDAEDKEEDLVPRAPVVVVMGHVDHGKTSLLDAIRKTNVVHDEAGGITQHIGAYKVKINDRDITFLDTPGHEAFTAMRARGAQATDIAILVVAADDGVMPQTIEAINHAKAANVSLIVAINKIDRPDANPDRVRQELADRGVLIEEWGGDVIAVPVSAATGENIEQLLEMVLLTADIMELKSNPDKQAKGIVIEAKLDKGRGPVATLLVQRGTLHTGDSIISGRTFGRIRAMNNDTGRKIDDAGPSMPVEVIGLDDVPDAGDVFYVVSDERVAKHLVDKRKTEQREQSIGSRNRITLDDLFEQIQQGEVKELNIIVKADVQGSVEAVKQSIEKLSNEEVRVQIIHGGVGSVNEADVTLAEVSNAIIIGFNVRPPANVMAAAETAGVDIRLYRIIYNAIEDIEKAMKGLLDPTYREVVDGHVEIRKTFKASSVGTIGGGYVTDGKIMRNSDVRVVRNGIVVYEGKLGSLKRFKDDAKEVLQGYECGVLIERFNDIKEGDVIEAFRMEEVERE